jgi:hypothetical protein
MRSRKTASFIFILLFIFVLLQFKDRQGTHDQLPSANNSIIHDAFKKKLSGIMVTGEGIVLKTLADDLKGSRHQRFIVKLDNKLSVLIAHNIDIAPRIAFLANGDQIHFKGEYERNKKGGVIHWTHHDPAGKHADGWLKHNNTLYK